MEDHPAEQTVERNGLETPVAGAPSDPFSTILGWSPADKQIVLLVLALKVLVLYLAVLSVGTLFDQYESWRTLWNRWDATHYLSLAENGYTDTGEGRFSIVFYPLYPWLVRVVAFVLQNYFGAALVVSGVASLCVGVLLRRLNVVGSPGEGGAVVGLVPFHFSDRIVSTYRIYGERIPRPGAGVVNCGKKAMVGLGRHSRSVR